MPDGPLIFIDTNILLDFYRAQNDLQLGLLARIDELHSSIICTYQVEMEFKKNRQNAIRDALKQFKASSELPSAPAFFKEAKTFSAAKKKSKQINQSIATLHSRAKKLLANPTTMDPVYKPVQRLFRCAEATNLTRDQPNRKDVRRRAWKRFVLGYPPRKANDTSIGDAINWEWIVDCSKESGRPVIIVSRDGDYGLTLDNESYINDWLAQEFRSRVSKKRELTLTTRLTDALRQANVAVSAEDEEGETQLLQAASGGMANPEAQSQGEADSD